MAFTPIIDVWQGSEFASDHDTVTFSNPNFLQNQFFLENYNKKEDISSHSQFLYQKTFIFTNIHYG